VGRIEPQKIKTVLIVVRDGYGMAERCEEHAGNPHARADFQYTFFR
jgi:hypothetical protein